MPTADASSLILHHYAFSPFSEKIRVHFGIKNLEWFACEQPMMMPKDEMIALTGGYRRIPVLQVGADLFFDSAFIIEEIERRFPEPAGYAGIGQGFGAALSGWCDSWAPDSFFVSIVALLFGGDLDVQPEFLEDRAALTGAPFDPEFFKAAQPQFEWRLRGHLAQLEAQFADGRPFLAGSAPSMADASFAYLPWFMRRGKGAVAKLLEGYPALLEWEKRVAAIGHGARRETTAAEAIAIAREATPAPVPYDNDPAPADPAVGAAVNVKYNDANTPILQGVLAGAGLRHVSVRYQSPEAGGVVLHMPRCVGTISAA